MGTLIHLVHISVPLGSPLQQRSVGFLLSFLNIYFSLLFFLSFFPPLPLASHRPKPSLSRVHPFLKMDRLWENVCMFCYPSAIPAHIHLSYRFFLCFHFGGMHCQRAPFTGTSYLQGYSLLGNFHGLTETGQT